MFVLPGVPPQWNPAPLWLSPSGLTPHFPAHSPQPRYPSGWGAPNFGPGPRGVLAPWPWFLFGAAKWAPANAPLGRRAGIPLPVGQGEPPAWAPWTPVVSFCPWESKWPWALEIPQIPGRKFVKKEPREFFLPLAWVTFRGRQVWAGFPKPGPQEPKGGKNWPLMETLGFPR